MIAPEVKSAPFEYQQDQHAYREWFIADTDVPDSDYAHLKRAAAVALREELTDKQRE